MENKTPNKIKRKKLKLGRVILASCIISGSIFSVDVARRSVGLVRNTVIYNDGSFKGKNEIPPSPENPTAVGNTQTITQDPSLISYLELAVPASELSKGFLAVGAVAAADNGSLVRLGEAKNEYYSVRDEGLMLNSEAAEALNELMIGYNHDTVRSDCTVYSTLTQDISAASPCQTVFSESVSGYTIDLAVASAGGYLPYDGKDVQGWVAENCWKYGFIQRYPASKTALTGQNGCTWHFRYVGKLHAAIIHANGFSLEEYVEWLKNYSVINPLGYTFEEQSYAIYYTQSMGDSTPVKIPINGNYKISGNNTDGYIVTETK